jgi:hypothetical protein
MGIIYSAVKLNKPEAWELGKNYYRLEDLFPPCKFNANEGFPEFVATQAEPDGFGQMISALAAKMPPRWEPGKPVPFVLTELYPTLSDFIAKAEELKGDDFTIFELPHWQDFYRWACSDRIVVIGEIDDWTYDNDQPVDFFCGELKNYRLMDSWNGEPGRRLLSAEEAE